MRNKLLLVTRLLCLAAFLWMMPNGIRAQQIITSSTWDGSTATQPAGWTPGNIKLDIASAAELAWVAKTVNDGTVTGSSGETGFEGCKITLTVDIDLDSHNWTPIGNWDESSPKYFKGSFDGSYSVIKNLVVEYNPDQPLYAGLFGLVGNESNKTQSISNLALFLGEKGIKGFRYAGGIAACINSASNCTVEIKDCYVEGNGITAYEPAGSTGTPAGASVGGILGYGCKNENCKISISIVFAVMDFLTAETECDNNDVSVGGIAGEINDAGIISLCYSLCPRFTTIQTQENTKAHLGCTAGNATPDNGISYNRALPFAIKTEENRYNNTKKISMPDNYIEGIDGQIMTSELLKDDFDNKFEKDVWDVDNLDIIPVFKRRGESNSYPTPPISDFVINDTGDSPYQITSEEDLYILAEVMNSGDHTLSQIYADKHYQLANDITLTSAITPIGTNNMYVFKGTFDGNHKCINNLSFKPDASGVIGLFGYADGATIKNLGVHVAEGGIQIPINSSQSTNLGAIVGVAYNSSNITDCFVTGGSIGLTDGTARSTNGTFNIGAIAGIISQSATVSNCYATNDIIGNNSGDVYCGGIVGQVYDSNVSNCYSTGKITAKSSTKSVSGGIAGDAANGSTFNRCISLNLQGIEAGGARICGTTNTPTYTNCYASPVIKVGDNLINDGALDNQSGLDLTLSNMNADAGGCFNGWNTGWELGDGTHLPKLQNFTGQPDLLNYAFLQFSITLTQPVEGGTLEVSYGTNQQLNDGLNEKIQGNTLLSITAKPKTGYRLKEITAGGVTIGGNNYKVETDTEITAVFEKIANPVPDPTPEPDPTPVYYTVSIPAVEGVVTDPVAGEYDVESWGNFRFYLTLNENYSQSVPIVTTDRGETIAPRSSDGAYIVKYVRSDVQIRIDGIVKNPDPVANEKIEASQPKIWKTGNELHIQAVTDEPGYIYTPDGKPQTVCRLIAGEVETVRLPDGIYFVRIGNERFKIVL